VKDKEKADFDRGDNLQASPDNLDAKRPGRMVNGFDVLLRATHQKPGSVITPELPFGWIRKMPRNLMLPSI